MQARPRFLLKLMIFLSKAEGSEIVTNCHGLKLKAASVNL